MMAIFNRSHYEDVLVPRVHETVPRAVWKQRYQQIREFEAMLVAEGTIVLKFFLHISKKEQKKRLDGARARSAQGVQGRPERLVGAALLGGVPAGVRGRDRRDLHGRRAMAHRRLAMPSGFATWPSRSALVARLEKEEARWTKAVVARGKAALAMVGKKGA